MNDTTAALLLTFFCIAAVTAAVELIYALFIEPIVRWYTGDD